MWLNKKHIKEGLDHKNLRVTTVKYLSDHSNKIFICKELAFKVIMDCRTTAAHKYRTRLGLKQQDVILTKEQPVLTKIKRSFKHGENMQTQYSALGFSTGFYFHDYKSQ